MENLGDKIRRYRKAQGLDQDAVAEIVGATQSAVSRWERDLQEPKGDNLVALAEWMGTTVEELTGARLPSVNDSLLTVECIGTVEAGAWVETWERPEGERPVMSMLADGRYPGIPRFALEVAGPSMDRLYPPGSFVVVVRYADFGGQPEHLDRVVCLRTARGDGVEATVKEYHVDSDGRRWLVPCSHHPAYQTPISLDPPPPGEEVTIYAKVVQSIRLEK